MGLEDVGGSFQRFDIADRRGIEQFLQGAAVVEATLHFRDQRFRHIERKALALEMTGKNPTRMLVPTLTSAAVFPDAPSAAQAERAESGGPEVGGLSLDPTSDIGGGFEFVGHVRYMSHTIYTCQRKNYR
jgi:hypothetical protein